MEREGEAPKAALLEHVTADTEEAEVSCVPEQPHGLVDGDTVRFEEVEGMDALCAEGKTFIVGVKSRHALLLGDTRGLGSYSGGGRIVQVKQPVTLTFKPLEEAMKEQEEAGSEEAAVEIVPDGDEAFGKAKESLELTFPDRGSKPAVKKVKEA